MRFRLEHPSEPHVKAVYGLDVHIGWWIEVRARGRPLESRDALATTAGENTVNDILDTLVSRGFLDADDLHQAMVELPHHDAAHIDDPAVKRAATVITNLRTAASEG